MDQNQSNYLEVLNKYLAPKCTKQKHHDVFTQICLHRNCKDFLRPLCAFCCSEEKHNQEHLLEFKTALSDLIQRSFEQIETKQEIIKDEQQKLSELNKSFIQIGQNIQNLSQKINQFAEEIKMNRFIYVDKTKKYNQAEEIILCLKKIMIENPNSETNLKETLKQISEFINIKTQQGKKQIYVEHEDLAINVDKTFSKYVTQRHGDLEQIKNFYDRLEIKMSENQFVGNDDYQVRFLIKSNYQDSQYLRELDKGKSFQGTNARQQLVVSKNIFKTGRHQIDLKIENFGVNRRSLMIGIVKCDQQQDSQKNQQSQIQDGLSVKSVDTQKTYFSSFAESEWPMGSDGCNICIFTGQGNQMTWDKTDDKSYEFYENIGKMIKEGDSIKGTLDVDQGFFEIYHDRLKVKAMAQQINFKIIDSYWRFCVGWFKSSVKMKLFIQEV